MQALGAAAPREGTCYLAGGSTAVLLGWRSTTIEVDIELVPAQDEVLHALPAIKATCRSTSSWPRRGTSSRFRRGGRSGVRQWAVRGA
jgi:hypothetical protein